MRLARAALALLLCAACASPGDSPAADSIVSSDSTSPPAASPANAAAGAAPGAAAGPTATESFRAVGQEPGWLLVVSDSLRLQWDYDARRLTVATPALQASSGARTYAFTHQDTAFTIRITDAPCADAMSGHQYASTVTVSIGARTLRGCGETPGAMLQGAAWSVDSLEGEPLVPGSAITMQFQSDGTVVGSGGCNRFRGGYTVRGAELTFLPAMTTKMACRTEVDLQEVRFLSAIGAVLRAHVEDGVLHLARDNTTVLTARRR